MLPSWGQILQKAGDNSRVKEWKGRDYGAEEWANMCNSHAVVAQLLECDINDLIYLGFDCTGADDLMCIVYGDDATTLIREVNDYTGDYQLLEYNGKKFVMLDESGINDTTTPFHWYTKEGNV